MYPGDLGNDARLGATRKQTWEKMGPGALGLTKTHPRVSLRKFGEDELYRY